MQTLRAIPVIQFQVLERASDFFNRVSSTAVFMLSQSGTKCKF
jgi:hypothetical protein